MNFDLFRFFKNRVIKQNITQLFTQKNDKKYHEVRSRVFLFRFFFQEKIEKLFTLKTFRGVIVPTFKENGIFILGVFFYSVNFCRLK